MALQTVTSLAIILFLNILSTIAADFTGQVVGVLDSDTIEVLHNNHFKRIRLNGIDCQKKGQAYAKRVKDSTGIAQVAAIIEVEHVEPSPLR